MSPLLRRVQDCDGLCGPSVVIRRYLSLAQTCKEMHALVMTRALPTLAARLPHTAWSDGSGKVPRVLRRLCRDPGGCSLAELQVAPLVWWEILLPTGHTPCWA